MILDRLFAPMTSRAFFRSHWPLRPLAVHGPVRRLGVPSRDLRSALAEHDRSITLYEIDEGYTTRRISRAAALDGYARGRTVRLDHADACRNDVRRYIAALAEAVGLPPEPPLAYAQEIHSPIGLALPMHFDPAEVFVMHLAGAKRWRLWDPTFAAPTESVVTGGVLGPDMRRTSDSLEAPARAPDAIVTMKPGSVLFLPRGTWHSTEALTPTVSISFVLATPPRIDLVLEQLRAELLRDVEWRRPALGALGTDAQARKAARDMRELALDRTRASDLLRRARKSLRRR